MKVRPVRIAELGSSDLAPRAGWYRQDPTLARAPISRRSSPGSLAPSGRPSGWESRRRPIALRSSFPSSEVPAGWAGPRAVGGPISDYQGVIHRRSLHWRAEELVRGCGLHVFEFDHLLVTQEPFQAYHRTRGKSPVIDLTDGFPSYRCWLRGRSQSLIRSIERWRHEYNTFRPHSALGYRPPSPETVQWPWPRDEEMLLGLT